MDTFDLNKTSKVRVNNAIHTRYGGRYSTSEIFKLGRAGVAGMIYFDESLESGKHVKVTLERLKNGLAIYFRNIDENRVLIFNFEEIMEVKLVKEEDILVKKSPSIFSLLLKMGVNYHYAKMFLLEHEIINEYKAELTIYPNQFEPIKLFITRKKPEPIIEFVDNLKDAVQSLISLKTFSYI